jgi:hypothetical protein
MTEAEAIEYGKSIANGNTVNVIEVKWTYILWAWPEIQAYKYKLIHQ